MQEQNEMTMMDGEIGFDADPPSWIMYLISSDSTRIQEAINLRNLLLSLDSISLSSFSLNVLFFILCYTTKCILITFMDICG